MAQQHAGCHHLLRNENLNILLNGTRLLLGNYDRNNPSDTSKYAKKVICLECKFAKKTHKLKNHSCSKKIFYDPNHETIICGICHKSLDIQELEDNNAHSPKRFREKLDLAEKLSKSPPKGLKNLGQTCFMNSVLQVFLGQKQLIKKVLEHKQCNVKNCIFCSFKDLLMSERSILKPNKFWLAFTNRNKFFGDYRQHDAQEFFTSLCNSLHDCALEDSATKIKKCFCVLHQLFSGCFYTEIECGVCYTTLSQKDEQFFDISLPVTDNNFMNMLDSFLKPEELSDKIYCKNCEVDRSVYKVTEIDKHPKILTLNPKLFTFNKLGPSKINRKISFPEKFYFDKNISYNLIGTVNHAGSLNYGHYTSYIRKNEEWFFCNDSNVSRASKETVLGSAPYLLFYEMKKIGGKSSDVGDLRVSDIKKMMR